MSKTEILAELPRLAPAELGEIWERLCDLEVQGLVGDQEVTVEEKALLEQELDDYRRNPNQGRPWHEVEDRLRGRTPQ